MAAGAQAIQLFDSWVGVVSAEDWEEFVLPPTAALVAAVRATGVPVIYFPNGATTLLERIAEVGADVYGIDWRLPIDEARARLRRRRTRAVQGNLDPALLLGPPDGSSAAAADVVRRGRQRGHVFNLGHGIYPRDADRERRGAGRARSRAPESMARAPPLGGSASRSTWAGPIRPTRSSRSCATCSPIPR